MFGSAVLDVAIGLALVYLLLSLVGTTTTEIVAGLLKLRSKNLEEGVRGILGDPTGTGRAKEFYEHPLIFRLSLDDSKPSYIPARSFALALMDIIAPVDPKKGPQTMDDLREAVNRMPEQETGLKKSLQVLLNDAQNDLNKARENVEKLFDEAMDRVTGWYKRKSQQIVFISAIVIAVTANADTLNIASTLYHDMALRDGVVTVAERAVKQSEGKSGAPTGAAAEAAIVGIKSELDKIHFPLGWKNAAAVQDVMSSPISKIVGWLLTAIAISLGAPFWFDMLNKIVNTRSAGIKPDKEKNTESPGVLGNIANATQAMGRGALAVTALSVGGLVGVGGTVVLKDAVVALKPGAELSIKQQDLKQLQQGVILKVPDDAFKNATLALKPGTEVKLRDEDARLMQQGITVKIPAVSLKETTVALNPKAEVRINKDDLDQLKLIVQNSDNTLTVTKLAAIDDDLKSMIRELRGLDPRGNISPR